MILLIDASAAIKLVLNEEHSDVARRVWDVATRIVAPTILGPEVTASIAAAHRDDRLDDTAKERAHALFDQLVEVIDLRTVDVDLSDAARRIAQRTPVRGMDAIYLAAARELAEPTALFSFDARQRAAATTLGVSIAPASVENDSPAMTDATFGSADDHPGGGEPGH